MTGATRNLVVVADPDDREAWLAARLDGLGGSDVSALMGENPYRSPIDVYESHCEPLGLEDDAGDRARVGNLLEGPALTWWAEGLPSWDRPGGRKYVWRPPMVARRDRLWQRGTADGLVSDTPGELVYDLDTKRWITELDRPWDGGVECKTHGWYAYRASYDQPEDPIPPDKKIQIAWYCELWGLRRWDLIALVDSHLQKHWTYWHDPAFGADLLTIAEDFWNKHILKRVRPEPDGSERWSKYINRKFPGSVSETVIASDSLDAIVKQLRAERVKREASKKECERLEQIITASMGAADTLKTSEGKITHKSQRGRLKTSTALPELYGALGWSRDQIAAFEDEHRGEDFRVFNVDRSWSKDHK